MTDATSHYPSDERVYKRRIRAWTLYDWANSAFATTILAAILPIYYSQVAGATLPSEAQATSYWSLTLSIALLISAILSPILGTVSDIARGKKRFLAIFVTLGIIGTAALVFVNTGDWLLASAIMVIARIGFTGANTFYDALLPHVARPEDQDVVSTRGYALGYLGGGLLLAINVVMIFQFGFDEGARWSFLTVALWWGIFSIPIFRQVPEPPAASVRDTSVHIVRASFARIRETLGDIRRYRELFKFLIAFLIYNDAIGTIIGVAAIYGTELGFDATELILALLLVQFVGIPFSIIFGWLPSPANNRRPLFLAFILFNLVALPAAGVIGAQVLPQDMTGVLLPSYETIDGAMGTGSYTIADAVFKADENWQPLTISPALSGEETAQQYLTTSTADSEISLDFNGQHVVLTYATGPDHGAWAVLLDGAPLLTTDANDNTIPVTIDTYSPAIRYGVTSTITAPEAGIHTLTLHSTTINPDSTGSTLALYSADVQAPISASSLPTIMGIVIALQLIGLLFAATIGKHLVRGLAEKLNTKRSILLALVFYSVIAMWGYILTSTIEFWLLAWMVAIVQGGSQALSRSLYATLSPASKSGEFFGLFGVMEKFSAFLGPLIFAIAAAIFGSSRPAILALISFFIIGGYLLTRVDVERGKALADAEDAATLQTS